MIKVRFRCANCGFEFDAPARDFEGLPVRVQLNKVAHSIVENSHARFHVCSGKELGIAYPVKTFIEGEEYED